MKTRSILTLGLTAWLLGACGGGGGGGGDPTGVFLDSPVGGLEYNTSGGSLGITSATGRFSYGAGQLLTFFVGDIVLGVAEGAAIVTPVDLAPGAVDETDEEVVNLARFLLTIDLDQDPDNGIEVPQSVRDAAVGVTIDFSQSVASFEAGEQAEVSAITAGLPGGSRTLVPALEAQQHLGSTLRRAVAGRYDGRFAGDDAGPFHVFVDREGLLFGWAVSPFDGLIGLTGSAATDGGFLAGNATTGAMFAGTIERDGTLAGTWQLDAESGTFQGTRTTSLENVLDEALIDLLAGTYSGTSTSGGVTEPFTVLVDGDGNLSLPPPDDRIAGTVVSTAGTTATFEALTDEGCVIRGTLHLTGEIEGTFRNDELAESGSFSGLRQ